MKSAAQAPTTITCGVELFTYTRLVYLLREQIYSRNNKQTQEVAEIRLLCCGAGLMVALKFRIYKPKWRYEK